MNANYEPPTLDELLNTDAENVDHARRAFQQWHSEALPLVDRGIQLLSEAAHAVGDSGTIELYEARIEPWAAATGLRGVEFADILSKLALSGDLARDQLSVDAVDGFHSKIAFDLRMKLFLKLQRDYLLMFGELMRFRAFACVGYWRSQIETSVLIRILHDQPRLASQWLDTHRQEAGKKFFFDTRREVTRLSEAWGMDVEFNEASGMAHHPRFMSLIPGVLIAQGDEPDPGAVGLNFGDVDHAAILFLWFWRSLVLHRKVLGHLEEMFPDVGPAVFAGLDRAGFGAEVDGVEAALRPYFDQLRERGFETAFKGRGKRGGRNVDE